MKTLRLNRADSIAYANGERRIWRAMRPQPQPNGGRALHAIRPHQTSPGTWTFVLAATSMGGGTGGRPCHYGKPKDRIGLQINRHGDIDTATITAITVEQRGGRWGWVVEVGA
jgi:hypothetical protein